MGDTSIEWTGKTINPIKAWRKSDGKKGWACVRVSPGCQHCYSEKQNEECGNNPGRHGTGLPYTVPALEQVDLYLDEAVLMEPLRWRKGTRIFPCSMTDWMADFVPDEWRDKMLAVMALTPQHTYLTLTKRADRQREYMNDPETRRRVAIAILDIVVKLKPRKEGIAIPIEHRPDSTERDPRFWAMWPLPNLWLGTSVENQQYADIRIPELLQTQAAVRWVSAEPLLEAINFKQIIHPLAGTANILSGIYKAEDRNNYCLPEFINWVVTGLESGPNARPGNIDWIRQIVAQCRVTRTPVFVKQLGSKPYLHKAESVHIEKPGLKFKMQSLEINSTFKLKDRKGGDMSEWPKDLRVREYPKVAHASA